MSLVMKSPWLDKEFSCSDLVLTMYNIQKVRKIFASQKLLTIFASQKDH